MNNQVSIGTIAILDSPKITVTENTVLKPKYELYVRGSAKYSIVTKNTSKIVIMEFMAINWKMISDD